MSGGFSLRDTSWAFFCECAFVEVSCPAYYYWYHFYLYSSIIEELYGLFEKFRRFVCMCSMISSMLLYVEYLHSII